MNNSKAGAISRIGGDLQAASINRRRNEERRVIREQGEEEDKAQPPSHPTTLPPASHGVIRKVRNTEMRKIRAPKKKIDGLL